MKLELKQFATQLMNSKPAIILAIDQLVSGCVKFSFWFD